MTANITPLAPARERREQMHQQWRDSVRLDAAHELVCRVEEAGKEVIKAAGAMADRWRDDQLPRERHLSILRKAIGDLSAALAAYMDAGSEPPVVADGG